MKKVLSTISVILFLLAGCVTASAETIPGVSVHTADGNPALKSETGEKPIEKSAEAERDKIKFEGEDKSGIEQDELPKIYTYINGVENMYQVGFYRKNISDLITVSPAYGRKVFIQKYSRKSQRWVTLKTYTTDNIRKAKLKITYPNEWKYGTESVWRIYAKECNLSDGNTFRAEGRYKKIRIRNNRFLTCRAAIVMDTESGKILYGYNIHKRRKAASMTKMMTAVLLNEKRSAKTKLYISKAAACTPYAMGLKGGDRITAKNALYSMMLSSSNEAATVVAKNIGGSVKNFARMMNRKARKIGCRNTFYENPHGLDTRRNHTTAYDTALIARYILKSDTTSLVRKAMNTRSYFFRTSKGRGYRLNTTDRMLYSNKDFIGMKTGTTGRAGFNFCGAFKYRGKTYITVVMGAYNEYGRWKNTEKLWRYTAHMIKNKML